MFSLIAKCLNIAMSKFVRLGLRSELRPASPKVSPIGVVNALGLYNWYAFWPPPVPGIRVFEPGPLGLPTWSAKAVVWEIPLPTPALSVGYAALNGEPVEKVKMPEYCHPPSARFFHPFSLKN